MADLSQPLPKRLTLEGIFCALLMIEAERFTMKRKGGARISLF